MNIYINKLIYPGAEEGVEVVECTELDLISFLFIFPFICFLYAF